MSNYCIVIPGPDDIYAMPSKEVAIQCAESHNKSMNAWLAKEKLKGMDWVTEKMVLAVVKEYPGTNAEHADSLEAFDESDWVTKEQP